MKTKVLKTKFENWNFGELNLEIEFLKIGILEN